MCVDLSYEGRMEQRPWTRKNIGEIKPTLPHCHSLAGCCNHLKGRMSHYPVPRLPNFPLSLLWTWKILDVIIGSTKSQAEFYGNLRHFSRVFWVAHL